MTLKKPAKPAKYRHPNNPTITWSGYGRKPDWFKAHLKDGGKAKELLI
ncbi:H-NS histone family protein [Suttonella sp. R2A3]|nr:H-NS histone family protein [Suttonella sp. R2A3]UJF24570.1 H-NS histone family protein [Suttonella sp. R2A3]